MARQNSNFFDRTDEAPMVDPVNPNLTETPNLSIAVNARYEPRRMLLTHITGSLWVLPLYYRQYLTAESELAAQEVNRPAVYQQYEQITRFELRVTEALRPEQNAETKEMQYRGKANIYPGIELNKGDMFIGDVGDGREMVFSLENVEQKSILRDTTYEIEYVSKGYLTNELRLDFIRKTTKKTVFVREFYEYGKNAFLIPSEYESYLECQNWLKRLPGYYYGLFFNENMSTFILPEQSSETYDPFLVEFLRDIIPTTPNPLFKRMLVLNRDIDTDLSIKTLWDALLSRDEAIFDYAPLKFKLSPVSYFPTRPRLSSVRYSGAKQVYYPESLNESGDNLTPSSPRVFQRPVDLNKVYRDKLSGLVKNIADEVTPTPLLKPVTADDYYVFSEAFYFGDRPNMSVIELMADNMLKRNSIGLELTVKVCETVDYWTRLEQYYYIPVLILALNRVIREIN